MASNDILPGQGVGRQVCLEWPLCRIIGRGGRQNHPRLGITGLGKTPLFFQLSPQETQNIQPLSQARVTLGVAVE
jgi:hypothetical protein